MSAPFKHGDGDGSGIRHGQRYDTNAREGVEGGGGTEVNDAQQDLDDGDEDHGVEGQVQVGVDLLPPFGARNGAVTGKGPSATGGGGRASNTTEDGQHHEGKEQGDGTARGPDGGLDDGGNRLARGESHEHGEIGEHKHQGHQEQQAANGVDDNGDDHGLGNLSGRVLDLLTHADDHARRRSGVRGMEETDAKRPSRRPARRGLEATEGKIGAAPALLGNGEDGDKDSEDSDKGPENGERLGVIASQPPVADRAQMKYLHPEWAGSGCQRLRWQCRAA